VLIYFDMTLLCRYKSYKGSKRNGSLRGTDRLAVVSECTEAGLVAFLLGYCIIYRT